MFNLKKESKMKNKFFIFGTCFMSMFLIPSCGDNSENNEDFSLKPAKLEVEGSASDYIEIMDDSSVKMEIRKDPLSKEKKGYKMKVKFNVVKQSDDWLDDMDLLLLDEHENEITEYGFNFRNETLTRNTLLSKINDGTGWYGVEFHNTLEGQFAETTFDEFERRLSEAKAFKIRAKMKPDPNKHLK